MTDTQEIDVVKVRLVNPEEIAIRVQESEPEHFITGTFVVQQGQGAPQGSGIHAYEQVLAQDPDRVGATLTSPDQAIVICHSMSQVNDPANSVTGVPFPQGAYLPAGGSLGINGTGRLWVVATTSSAPARVSVTINRRGNA